jgi:hypothetical protein
MWLRAVVVAEGLFAELMLLGAVYIGVGRMEEDAVACEVQSFTKLASFSDVPSSNTRVST